MRRDSRGASVRPSFRPSGSANGRDAGTLVLRDGSRCALVRCLPEDAHQVQAFLARMEDAERRELLGSLRLDEAELGPFLATLAEPSRGEALVVRGAGSEQVGAFGAFRLLEGLRDAAFLGIAVEPSLRRLGVATLLLERLAVLAARRGVGRLAGSSGGDDRSVVALYRAAGFEPDVREGADSATFLISTRPAVEEQGQRRVGSARAFTAASLRPLFLPRSVAVAGASRDPSSLGHRLVENLVRSRFDGPVYPVNPAAEHVLSIRAFPSLEAIGHPVDLALVAVPAAVVPEVVRSAAAAGVRALVVVSAGFAEAGPEGRRLERTVLEEVRRHGLRMVGPGSMGVVHTGPEGLNASLSPLMPLAGTVALCSSSGAVGVAIIALSRRLGLGLSSFVAVGSPADVSANELLEYWGEDERTRVILLYLEDFGNPRQLARLARRVGRAKPIVTVRAGLGRGHGRETASRSATLAASDAAAEALFWQTGVIRAATLLDMFGVARLLSDQPLPRGRRVGVVANCPGPASLCVEALEAAGMRVEPLAGETRSLLRCAAEPLASNPVTLLPGCGADDYRHAVEVVLAAPEVDALVVVYAPLGPAEADELGRSVAAAVEAGRQRGGAGKPVVASIVGEDLATVALGTVSGERVPVFPFPEAVGRLLGQVADYAEWRSTEPGVFPEFGDQRLAEARDLCRRSLEAHGSGWLPLDEVHAILAAAAIPMASTGVATSAEAAVRLASGIGYPVAVKLASPALFNRAELGGVALGLEGPKAVREAFAGMRARAAADVHGGAFDGVVVQPMLEGAAEVMIGARDDPTFGPVIGFGLGGVHVETLGDVAFRVSPLTDVDARGMIRELRGYPLLEGFRGHPSADLEALEGALLRLSALVEAVPEVAELDLNPVFAFPPGSGYGVVGARIRLKEPSRR